MAASSQIEELSEQILNKNKNNLINPYIQSLNKGIVNLPKTKHVSVEVSEGIPDEFSVRNDNQM